MKVFVSWSGDLSHRVAGLLQTWLEDVLQGCTVWVSSENIEKGSVWFSEVSDTLKDTTFGISCVSRDNAAAPWLLFEAGALSKGLSSSRVSPLLIDISPADLKQPLSLFNATKPNEEDMRRLVKDINKHSGDSRLADDRLDRAFHRCWPEFTEKFETLRRQHASAAPVTKRTDRDLLEEVVEVSKSLYRTLQDSRTMEAEAEMRRQTEFEKRSVMLERQLVDLVHDRRNLEVSMKELARLKDELGRMQRSARNVEPWIVVDPDSKREWVLPFALQYYIVQRNADDEWFICDRWEDTPVPTTTAKTRQEAVRRFYMWCRREMPDGVTLSEPPDGVAHHGETG